MRALVVVLIATAFELRISVLMPPLKMRLNMALTALVSSAPGIAMRFLASVSLLAW